ncbi:MAG TPA: hypothetical protein V6C65_04165 [Allocoleopsis sp.]
MTEIREVREGTLHLLPPAPGLCQQCAIDHPSEQPHDATSLFYGFWFVGLHGRSPTWADAMAHCTEEVKQVWSEYLSGIGIDINSTNVKGGISSKEELDDRLNKYEQELDREISNPD